MNRKIALVGILAVVIMVLTGCIYYGGHGYYGTPHGYGYFTYHDAPYHAYGYHHGHGHGDGREGGRYQR